MAKPIQEQVIYIDLAIYCGKCEKERKSFDAARDYALDNQLPWKVLRKTYVSQFASSVGFLRFTNEQNLDGFIRGLRCGYILATKEEVDTEDLQFCVPPISYVSSILLHNGVTKL